MSDIEEIKSRLNIVDIVGAKVQLKKTGRNFKGLCPFHSEKTPSFIVSPDRQTFHCFGCHKGGSVFDFVMEYNHIDFVEALEDLADKAGVKLTHKHGDTPQEKLKQKMYEVNHLASEFYHYLLTKHALGESAREYLKNRGVTEKSIKTFSLGYSPNSWDGLLKFLRKKGYDEQLLETAGLVIKRNGYYDRFRGRIMFTLKDHRGQVVGFAGRVLDPKAKEAKYINTSETPVYMKSNVLYGLDVTKGNIQKANDAVVMEGELDVISSFQEGVSNVVAIKGSALTEGHVNLLKRFTERVTFALDSDMAGDAAARRGIEIADKAGLDMKVVILPSGKDPDDAVRENPAVFKKAIDDAIPIYDYFIRSVVKRLDVTTAFGKKKASEELLPILAKIENSIVQGHYVKQFAKAINTSEQTVTEALRSMRRPAGNTKVKEAATPSTKPRFRLETLELYALALLLQGRTVDLFEEFTEHIHEADIEHPAIAKIVNHLAAFLSDHPIFLIKDFADSLPEELLPTLDEAFLWDVSSSLENEDLFVREWDKTLNELERTRIKRQITVLSAHEKQDDDEDTEVRKLTDRLKALEKV